MAQGGRGKKRCHFPPEGDIIGNAITRKCKLGMLTYITIDISLCPPEWYQSAKFRVLAHALLVPVDIWQIYCVDNSNCRKLNKGVGWRESMAFGLKSFIDRHQSFMPREKRWGWRFRCKNNANQTFVRKAKHKAVRRLSGVFFKRR